MLFSPAPGAQRDLLIVVDSAAGGLGIMQRIVRWSSGLQVVYLADTALHPFGLKPAPQIAVRVAEWFAWAASLPGRVRALVIACNTASIAGQERIPELTERYAIPAFTMLQGMEALISANVAQIHGRRVGLMGTRLTIEAGVYQPMLMRREPRRIIEVVATATEQAVARGGIHSPAGLQAARSELEQYVNLVGAPEAIILGCTCYEFAAAPIRAAFGETVALLNPADAVADLVRRSVEPPPAAPNAPPPLLLSTAPVAWGAQLLTFAEQVLHMPLSVYPLVLPHRS